MPLYFSSLSSATPLPFIDLATSVRLHQTTVLKHCLLNVFFTEIPNRFSSEGANLGRVVRIFNSGLRLYSFLVPNIIRYETVRRVRRHKLKKR